MDLPKIGTTEGQWRTFHAIESAYREYEAQLAKDGKKPMRHTDLGFWGAANMRDIFEFALDIKLATKGKFLDLGCGDGRVVAIASIFTHAIGIDCDKELIADAIRICAKLNLGPIEFQCGNYLNLDFSTYDILFINPDQFFSLKFERKILDEFQGDFYVYNSIYRPNYLPRGRTHWFRQMPITCYDLRKP